MEEEDIPCSSFLKEVRGKLKKGLQPTLTKMTKSDGSVTILEKQGQVIAECYEQKTAGFVIDLKPDLTLARVKSWLMISSQDVPNDFSIVKENKITYILSLIPNFSLQATVHSVVKQHLCLSIYDEECFSLSSPDVQQAINFIQSVKNVNEKVGSNECVLVHCNAGISRAPSIVMMYLMMKENLSFGEAHNDVLKVRPNARPNSGFLKQLKSFKPQP